MNLTGPLATVAAYARRTHTATCVITRPGAGEPVLNEETGLYDDPVPVTVYDGPCQVTATGGDRVQDFGEGPIVTRTYDIVLDGLDDGVKLGDTATVAFAGDPRVDGRALTVIDVLGSSLPTNRQLTAEEQVNPPAGG